MTEQGKKIEKVSRSATALFKWIKKNGLVIVKKHKIDELAFEIPPKLKLWLEMNCLGLKVLHRQKRIEIYPIYCEKLAVRLKMS